MKWQFTLTERKLYLTESSNNNNLTYTLWDKKTAPFLVSQ